MLRLFAQLLRSSEIQQFEGGDRSVGDRWCSLALDAAERGIKCRKIGNVAKFHPVSGSKYSAANLETTGTGSDSGKVWLGAGR